MRQACERSRSSSQHFCTCAQRLRASSYLAHGDGYPLQPGHQSMSMGNEDAKVQMWLRGSTSTRAPLQLEGTEEGSDADDDRGDDEGDRCCCRPVMPHLLIQGLLSCCRACITRYQLISIWIM